MPPALPPHPLREGPPKEPGPGANRSNLPRPGGKEGPAPHPLPGHRETPPEGVERRAKIAPGPVPFGPNPVPTPAETKTLPEPPREGVLRRRGAG